MWIMLDRVQSKLPEWISSFEVYLQSIKKIDYFLPNTFTLSFIYSCSRPQPQFKKNNLTVHITKPTEVQQTRKIHKALEAGGLRDIDLLSMTVNTPNLKECRESVS